MAKIKAYIAGKIFSPAFMLSFSGAVVVLYFLSVALTSFEAVSIEFLRTESRIIMVTFFISAVFLFRMSKLEKVKNALSPSTEKDAKKMLHLIMTLNPNFIQIVGKSFRISLISAFVVAAALFANEFIFGGASVAAFWSDFGLCDRSACAEMEAVIGLSTSMFSVVCISSLLFMETSNWRLEKDEKWNLQMLCEVVKNKGLNSILGINYYFYFCFVLMMLAASIGIVIGVYEQNSPTGMTFLKWPFTIVCAYLGLRFLILYIYAFSIIRAQT